MTQEALATPFDPVEDNDDVAQVEDTAAEAQEGAQDSPAPEAPDDEVLLADSDPPAPSSTPVPAPPPAAARPEVDPEVQAMQNELNGLIAKHYEMREESKRVAKAWREKVDAVETQIHELNTKILDRTWDEDFDYVAGVVYRTNRLTGAAETRPLGDAERQLHINSAIRPLTPVAAEISGVEVGTYGEDPEGEHFRVTAIAADSIVIEYADGGTERIQAKQWGVYSLHAEQSEYKEAFDEDRKEFDDGVLDALFSDSPQTIGDIATAVDCAHPDRVEASLARGIGSGFVIQVEGEGYRYRDLAERILDVLHTDTGKTVTDLTTADYDEDDVTDALSHLVEQGKAATRDRDGTVFYYRVEGEEETGAAEGEANPPNDESNEVIDYVTSEWQTAAAIQKASGLEQKRVSSELKRLLDAGKIEAEGKTRGRTYRLVSQ